MEDVGEEGWRKRSEVKWLPREWSGEEWSGVGGWKGWDGRVGMRFFVSFCSFPFVSFSIYR